MARNKPRPAAANRGLISAAPAMGPTQNPTDSGPNVSYVRPEVTAMQGKWQLMSDCLAGQDAIKLRGETYLPMPRVDGDEEQKKRYATYLQRAVFYNATRRTLDGLMGEVFSRAPVIKVPDAMGPNFLANLDGEGSSAAQVGKKALSFVMSKGRAGMLSDYPDTGGIVTAAQKLAGGIRPVVKLYGPEKVINWRTKVRGATKVFDLVVLAQDYLFSDDGFEQVRKEEYYVLRLVAGASGDEYQYERWRAEYDDKGVPTRWFIHTFGTPTDGAGKPFDTIPFQIAGCIDNNEFPDEPPLYDLAVLNIGHYRNSADYEEACFICGQPTAFFSGLTRDWVEEVFKGGQVYLGSRGVIPLPQGGNAGLLQVNENSMPKEAMEHKEAQMAAIGAKLVDKSGAQRTLGEAQIDETASSSILSAAAENVSAALTQAIRWAVQFETGKVDDQEVSYSLNTDFPSARLTPNERAQLMLEWQGGGISWEEYRNALRRAGVATGDDEEVKKEGEEMAAKKQADALALKSANSGGTDNGEPKLNTGNNGGNQAGT